MSVSSRFVADRYFVRKFESFTSRKSKDEFGHWRIGRRAPRACSPKPKPMLPPPVALPPPTNVRALRARFADSSAAADGLQGRAAAYAPLIQHFTSFTYEPQTPKPSVLKKQKTLQLDGGDIAELRGSVVTGNVSLLYGTGLVSDPRIQSILVREHFLLNMLIPRHSQLTWRFLGAFFTVKRALMLAFYGALFFGATWVCAKASDDPGASFCDGGAAATSFSFQNYRSALVNGLATLLFSFYANLAVSEYKTAYLASRAAQDGLIRFLTLAVAEMGDQPGGTEALIELWRSANLCHLASYCMLDKGRTVYSFDHFLLPTAEAFGQHDGHERLGMFRRSELESLGKTIGRTPSSVSPPMPASGALAALTGAGSLGDDLVGHLRPDEFSLVGDARGDVRSDVALIYHSSSVRCHRLVREAMKHGLSTAPWPTWYAALDGMFVGFDDLRRRGLYRVPKLYRICVFCVTNFALAADAFEIGTVVGRVYHADYQYAHAALAFAATMLSVILVTITLLISACMDMEEPYGNNPMDLPGLNYARSAAEVTLNMVAPHPLCTTAMEAFCKISLANKAKTPSTKQETK